MTPEDYVGFEKYIVSPILPLKNSFGPSGDVANGASRPSARCPKPAKMNVVQFDLKGSTLGCKVRRMYIFFCILGLLQHKWLPLEK